MKPSNRCPDYITGEIEYDCLILESQRLGKEEEICSLCSGLMKNLEQRVFFRKAFDFAKKYHMGQCRKGTHIPYLIHPIRTWDYVSRMTENEETWIAAMLHDVIEDTPATEEDLRVEFGDKVALLVMAESEQKRKNRPAGETWQIRKGETLDRLQNIVENKNEVAALHIAFADKLANLYSMAYEYRQIGDVLWRKFNQKDKRMHAWYYGEMGNIFRGFYEVKEPKLMKEYDTYYKEVFGKYEISKY